MELDSNEKARERLARLMGVQFKEPFGDPYAIPVESSDTGSYRGWAWNRSKFTAPGADKLWQYQVLNSLYKEPVEGKFQFPDLESFALSAAYESDIAKYLLKSTRKYVCTNKETRDEINEVIDKANIKGITDPQGHISYAGGAVSGIIVTSAPFGAAFAPVAGVITIYVLRIGLDAFCDWSEEYIKKFAPP